MKTRNNERWGRFSPDGKWIAYESDESGEYEVYVRRFPGAGEKRQVSTGGGTKPVWNRDGKELFYRNGDQVVAVAIATEGEIVLGPPTVLFERRFTLCTRFNNFDVTPEKLRVTSYSHSRRSWATVASAGSLAAVLMRTGVRSWLRHPRWITYREPLEIVRSIT